MIFLLNMVLLRLQKLLPTETQEEAKDLALLRWKMKVKAEMQLSKEMVRTLMAETLKSLKLFLKNQKDLALEDLVDLNLLAAQNVGN